MDFAVVMKALGEFILKVCAIKLSFAGIEFSVGGVFVFVGVVGLLLYFMNESGD